MQDIFGILVFLGIAVVAVIRKVYEQREAVRRQGESPELRPDELPEQVRRMLFGEDDDAPVAQPRRPEPVARQARPLSPGRQPTARPRRPTPVTLDPRTARPARQPERVATRQQEMQRNVGADSRQARPDFRQDRQDMRQVRTEVRQTQQDTRQARTDMRQTQTEGRRSVATDMQRRSPAPRASQPAQQQAMAPVPRRVEPQQERKQKQGPRKAPPIQPVHRPEPPRSALFRNRGDLRQALIYTEVLGKPKGLQDLG